MGAEKEPERGGAAQSFDEASAGLAAAPSFPWLLRQKITIPDQVAGYVDRAELLERAMPTNRRLTVLKASAGFGKTTLLSECCRRLFREGVATAWVSLDERDEPPVLETYIASACMGAGLNLSHVLDWEGAGTGLETRTAAVVCAIQTFGHPFVIAFDELERLENPGAVTILEFLLQRGPPNLHLAFACRQIPGGLNVAGAVLEGRAEVLGAEELRFSRADVARFFELSLSRRQLAEEMDRSFGWPLAMRISRNGLAWSAKRGDGAEQDMAENWIDSRLIADLGHNDRDFLLDLGLFDWIDVALLDEVLRCGDSAHRLESMDVLTGLLQPSRSGETKTWQLHPLVREHCVRLRFRESPERFQTIHRRIAHALGRRGQTVSAMRHAIESGDPFLAGELLEQGGGIRLWTRQGLVQLLAADRLVTEEAIARHPRLALMRCMVMGLTGRMDEGRRRYQEVCAAQAAQDVDNGGADFEFSVDQCIVNGGMALYGGNLVASDWLRSLSLDTKRVMDSSRLDLLTRGHFEYALCVLHQLRGEFDSAFDRLAAARSFLGGSQYIAFYGEILEGQVEMVWGRVREAELHFRRAKRIAKRNFALDPVPTIACKVCLKVLSHECNLASFNVEPEDVSKAFVHHSPPFSLFTMAATLIIELRIRAGQLDQALGVADDILAYLRGAGLTTFIRYLAPLRTSLLLMAGRVQDAERSWMQEGLPEKLEDCVDLANQTWWGLEAISCARLRWLVATERFEEGRAFAGTLNAVAIDRRLRRTQMRGLTLWVALEQRAGNLDSALQHLAEFLALYAESPYAWPMVQERSSCAPVVQRFLELYPESPHRGGAQSILAAMRRVEDVRKLMLSERELQVLRGLRGHRDKQIASELGLTVHGVRFHLRKLFKKLGVANRAEATRRAKELELS